mgnify:FL=1
MIVLGVIVKFTGLTRRIEIGGRLSLPKGIREHFQTEYIQIYVQKNMIYLSCNVEESKLTKDSLFQIKKIDSVGRLYIPLEIRSSLHLMDYGDEVEIYIDNANQIVLKKRCLRCVFCSNKRAGMLSFQGADVCPECAEKLPDTYQKYKKTHCIK